MNEELGSEELKGETIPKRLVHQRNQGITHLKFKKDRLLLKNQRNDLKKMS